MRNIKDSLNNRINCQKFGNSADKDRIRISKHEEIKSTGKRVRGREQREMVTIRQEFKKTKLIHYEVKWSMHKKIGRSRHKHWEEHKFADEAKRIVED